MEFAFSPWVVLLGLVVTGWLGIRRMASRKHLPPGPSPLPIIGNLHQMPKEREWLVYGKWAEKYGDIMYLNALGQHVIILNTQQVANDLLAKRSSAYSSRPRFVMAGELVGLAQNVALMPYSEQFRKMRGLFQKEFSGEAEKKYHPLHESESRLLVTRILARPERFSSSIRLYVGSIILRIVYGYTAQSEDDQFLAMADELSRVVSQALQPGAWVVDILPFLLHIPSWFPGAFFKREAARWNHMNNRASGKPYAWTKDHLGSPDLITPNFVASSLSSRDVGELSAEDDYTLKWSAWSMFGGGSDTTVSMLCSFFLAMALNAAIQQRAQEEVDRVTGGQRLPLLEDRPALQFLQYIVLETLRWHPVGPLGVPHLLDRDDTYEGYHLPKGSIVIVNIWSALHDPDVFPEPSEFKPMRYYDDETAVSKVNVCFGFGRRACPGSHFARSSMFIAMATVLATCHISEAVDEAGLPVKKDVAWQPGTLSHPPKFSCKNCGQKRRPSENVARGIGLIVVADNM